MKDFGYDISNYCDVDPIFGMLEDFKTLLSKAHQQGLSVLIDQVWNHTSDHLGFNKAVPVAIIPKPIGMFGQIPNRMAALPTTG